MLFPVLSVTLIGIVGTIAGIALWKRTLRTAIPLGIVGAWLGFVAGAIVGVIVDVVFQTGIFVGIIGHLGAIVGTIAAFRFASFAGFIRKQSLTTGSRAQ